MRSDPTRWIVLKFGGTSVSDAANWQTIGRIVMRLRVIGTDQFSVGFDRAAIRMVAWIAALAIAPIFRNHCSDSNGSIIVSHR